MRIKLTIFYSLIIIVFMIGLVLVVNGHTPKPKNPDCEDKTPRSAQIATGWIMMLAGLIAVIVFGIYIARAQSL